MLILPEILVTATLHNIAIRAVASARRAELKGISLETATCENVGKYGLSPQEALAIASNSSRLRDENKSAILFFLRRTQQQWCEPCGCSVMQPSAYADHINV